MSHKHCNIFRNSFYPHSSCLLNIYSVQVQLRNPQMPWRRPCKIMDPHLYCLLTSKRILAPAFLLASLEPHTPNLTSLLNKTPAPSKPQLSVCPLCPAMQIRKKMPWGKSSGEHRALFNTFFFFSKTFVSQILSILVALLCIERIFFVVVFFKVYLCFWWEG